MNLERFEILVCGFQWCILNAQKVLSRNKFKKMKCLCNCLHFALTISTSKEMVQFVHEVHPVFAVTLSNFAHMLCGSNDDTCQVSTFSDFICTAFQFQGHLAQNKSLNA